eukprot:UN02201
MRYYFDLGIFLKPWHQYTNFWKCLRLKMVKGFSSPCIHGQTNTCLNIQIHKKIWLIYQL